MSISYHRNDELPAWQAEVPLNKVLVDFSVGWTFEVRVYPDGIDTPVLTKSAGVTGYVNGVVQTHWDAGDLDLDPGLYSIQLTGSRNSDGAQWTVGDDLIIRPR
jgi:hypothetical protein